MKIMRFHSADGFRLGVQAGDTLVDLNELRSNAPRDLAALLKMGPAVLAEVRAAAKAARSPGSLAHGQSAEVHLPRSELPGSRCRIEKHPSAISDIIPARSDVSRRSRRSNRATAGFDPARLRSRACGNCRPPPAKRHGRRGSGSRCRLCLLQRWVGPRIPAAHHSVDDGKEFRPDWRFRAVLCIGGLTTRRRSRTENIDPCERRSATV